MPEAHGDLTRRRRLRAAVLQPVPQSPAVPGRPLRRAVSGVILDAAPGRLALFADIAPHPYTGFSGSTPFARTPDAGAARTGAAQAAGARRTPGPASAGPGDPGRSAPPGGAWRTAGPGVVSTYGGGRPWDAWDETVLRPEITAETRVWFAGKAGVEALRPGRRVIVALSEDGTRAERIWVEIVRVTGTIVSAGRDTVEVDRGPHRGRARVTLPRSTRSRIQVRHPNLAPGFLIDVIGIRSKDGPVAVLPGTFQPGYRADDKPAPPPGGGAGGMSGTLTWFGGTDVVEGSAARGAAYPALDAEGDAGGCSGAPAGCASLPYLSLGSELIVRNDCTGETGIVHVTECGCVAAHFCDRCVKCGTSPRGRLAELTALSFVELGGDLDAGCVAGTLTMR